MLKRLNIENFESIKGKETQNLKIEDAGWDSFNDQYYIMFDIKGNQTSARGEVIIKREPSSRYKGAFYLEIRWEARNNCIYNEDVMHGVFKKKTEMFAKLDEIIMEKLKNKNIC
jgi:hypothetical protein